MPAVISDFLEESKQEFGEEEPRPKEMEGDAAPAELSDRQPRNNGHVFVYQTATDNEGGENRDDQDEQGNIRGFIDYGDEEDMDDEDEEYGDFLDDDDLDLIEENLGVKVKRRKMYKRIKTLDDEEDDGDLKDCIAQDLFHGVAESELEEGEVVEEPLPQADDDEGEDERSDIDDFIVGDNDQLLPKKKGNKLSGSTAVACQEAKELFGGSSAFADLNADAKQGRKSILEIYEPSELESHYMTDQDKEIRATDMPERFQLRSIPVKPCEDHELEEEAEWIFRHGFSSPTVSTQDSTNYLDKGTTTNCSQKGLSMVAKIKEALNFMRNQQFEVPFIAFYRKEYVEPELNINDLWKVWQWDEKWTRFQTRKQNITRLFQQMQSRQLEQISADPDVTRPLDTADMERLKDVQTVEELGDVHSHFFLYYGRDIPKRQNAAKANKNSLQRIEEEKKGPYFRQPSRRDTYSICQSRGLDCLAKKFGLTPEQFGENLRDGYQHYETRQFPAEPVEMAKDYVCSRLSTPEAVLEATRYMVAIQIAHEPLVRHVLRQTFQERAKINTKPTVKGEKEIDEAHFARSFKYVKNKPVKELDGDQFLRMCLAEDEGLLSVDISIDLVRDKRHAGDQTYFDEIKQLYYKEEFSHQIQEWNRQRSLAIETSLTQVLYPQMAKELKNKLMAEAKESVVRSCRSRLFNWLKVAPYKPDQLVEEDDDPMDENQGEGIRVLGVAYSPSRNTPVFCALINGEGEVTDVLRLPNFMKRRNAFREDERGKKAQDVEKLKKFLTSKKPHVVAVAGENRDANMIIEDIETTISELEQESSLLTMRVELVDNELAKLYMNSKKSEVDFVDYPPLLRQAVSIGRKVQDPLMEYAQVCSTDDDILCLKLHPLQHVAKENLLPALDCEFINRVCEVGVDVNKALCYPHTQSLVQYVCGLGPRKGSHLLKILKHNGTRLTNRVQLMTVCHMGPRVFTNCAGFIKIDTAYLGDSTDPYINALDRSRVHPEAYEWARKIAVDALDCDVSAEADPLEEISENPQPLKDLDLDAFAELLEREGHGKKGITLYDICAELSCKYKDIRVPYRQPNTEEIFNLLTKETPETFYVGMLTTSVVTGIAHQRPSKGHYEPAICNNATKLWQCPFCRQDNFPEVSEVVDHIDSGLCRGRAFGVWSQLDNGIQGFIPTKFLSDKVVKHPEDKVKVGMAVDCRITKISFEKLRVDLTCRTSDLSDKTNVLKFPKDKYYDYDAESEDHKQEEDLTKKRQQTPYIRLEVNHPNFHNITFMQAERMMETLHQGDVIFRPSSKAENHLTLTWKVTDDIHQPVDVIEEGKENAFSLGRWFRISDEKFEDLDEIVARYVVPMTLFARDLLRHKYFQGCSGGNKEKMAELLVRTMRKKPAYMAYFISASKELPGKFLLGYQPGENPRCEYVTVTPHGYRFRSRIFPTVDTLFCWFKAHYHEPVPGSTPHSSHCR